MDRDRDRDLDRDRDRESLLPKTADGKLHDVNRSRPMTTRGIAAALSYMLCAVLLVMFNKAALSSYKFPCANVLTLLQVVGMASIRGVSVPMYTSLRRTTVVFTMGMEFVLADRHHSPPIICSVAMIVLGACVASVRDLSFSAYGYLTVFLSNFTTAVYLATIARLGKATGLNSFGLMWCNGILCGPVLLLWTWGSGEMRAALNYEHVHEAGFQAVIGTSCLLAFALNYTIFLNTSLNSALTQTMCGNLKDFGTVALGWVWFGGPPFDLLNVVGQALGFWGSGMYAYCKLRGR